MKHLTEDQILTWLDGGLAPNEIDPLESHLSECATCRQSKAELETFAADLRTLPTVDEEAHVKAVMRRVDGVVPAPADTKERRPRWPRVVAAAAVVLAIAAAIVLVVRSSHDGSDRGTFASRGGEEARTLRRDVGVDVYSGATDPVRLVRGSKVRLDSRLSAATTNVHPKEVRLLLFAVDAQNTVHWLYPAYTSAKEDPEAIVVERSDRPRMLPSSVVLDAPARGPLRLVALVAESVLHVSDIEKRPPEGLRLDALEKAFPRAALLEIDVVVE